MSKRTLAILLFSWITLTLFSVGFGFPTVLALSHVLHAALAGLYVGWYVGEICVKLYLEQ